MQFKITRKKLSHTWRANPNLVGDWANQRVNNSLDLIELLQDDGSVVWSSPSQTVANLESLDAGVKYEDTIAPGPFAVKLFVDPRDFWCQPHGIIRATTLAGEYIDENSVTPSNPSRWLMHDLEKHKSVAPQGSDTSVAWSAGCFVEPDKQLAVLNTWLLAHGFKANDIITGFLYEEVS